MSSRLLNTVGFFFLIVLLMTALRYTKVSGFRGGEAIGGRTDGPAASMLTPAEFEGFRGGESIGGRTDGPASSDLGMQGPASSMLEPAALLKEKDRKEGFVDLDVKGKSEVNPDSGPGPASLTQPRKPYHLLSDVLQNAPRDTVGCLTAGCCNETDFEARTNLTGNYLQRTNNYKRDYPDNCTGPLHDFTMAFYKTVPLKDQIA
jgi:hypothetical protein